MLYKLRFNNEESIMNLSSKSVSWFLIRFTRIFLIIVIIILLFFPLTIFMPGDSFDKELPLTSTTKDTQAFLRQKVSYLAQNIGVRHRSNPGSLGKAAHYIYSQFMLMGYPTLIRSFNYQNFQFQNVVAIKKGITDSKEILVIGAHYDTVEFSPGANDNASGVASMLYLAKQIASLKLGRTIHFVAFANEEAPFFGTDGMGSLNYAQNLKKNGMKVLGMISLETMGYFSNQKDSQKYPFPLNYFYPDHGNFIGFVSNPDSKAFLFSLMKEFRKHALIPSRGVAATESLKGIGWSDHFSFWQQDWPAVMITDTAFFRYPHYHTPQDTSDKIDYHRLALVIEGLAKSIPQLIPHL